jgi:predicted RNase H-like HicB family nuclease
MVVLPLDEAEGGGFSACAPDLPGCMGDGETPEEAATDLLRAVDEWIDEAQRLGRAIPNPGDFVHSVRTERGKIQALIAAQDDLIKKLETVIKQQDRGLQEARAEIDKIKGAILSMVDCDAAGDRAILSLAAAGPILAIAARKPHTAH